MTEDQSPLELRELAHSAGVTPRTIRYYIGQGLLPPPSGRGPGASYGREHLDRLLLIRRLQEEHLPLAEIRKQLEGLDDAAVSSLMREPPAPPSSSALDYVRSVLEPRMSLGPAEAGAPYTRTPPPTSAPSVATGERSQWERIAVTADIEVHVRRPLARKENRIVELLLEYARELVEEEKAP